MARTKLSTDEPEELLRKWAERVPMSQTEVARCMGLSRPKVWRIEMEAMGKIRAALERDLGLGARTGVHR